MVVALFVLALAMLLGGLASVVQGIPYVRLEVGWTMVIAGSVAASGGAVVLGLAALLGRLRRIELALRDAPRPAERRDPAPAPIRPEPPTLPPAAPMPASLMPASPMPAAAMPAAPTPPAPAHPPVAAMLGGAGVAGAAALAAGVSDGKPAPGRSEPTFDPPADRLPEPAAPRDDAAAAAAELRLNRAEPEPFELPMPEPAEPAPPPETAPETVPEPGTVPEPEAPPAEEENAIVGTYASGGNTYAMFADGTIEADTPGGKFRFRSLDELKAFIAEGGEGGESRTRPA
ncbi:hypothetical protein [Methylobacterium oryzihabitans]|uniref:Uncharacterized protein n=1 Tax=Methylobacterium oryzihabitans TaxID=2499852 RepID=A0A3S2VK39_9HYPH|nr:hypothetical protein [Methylobacterium oryzihabitans]RVU14674.1 hypothetical protein EOE48_22490 [Methylobacterium oryzihabitans]